MPVLERDCYKRIHFFRYFLTEEDWNSRHRYHNEKQWLHNNAFHGVGIFGDRMSLFVHASVPNGMSFVVQSGKALDTEGREIISLMPVEVKVDPDNYDLPCTLYIYARYSESESDRVRFPDGRIENRYFKEGMRIVLSQRVSESDLELARVQLNEHVKAITNAKDPEHPGPGEIDLRNVLRCPEISMRNAAMIQRVRQIIAERSVSYKKLAGNPKLNGIGILQQNFDILNLILDTRLMNERTFEMILDALKELDGNVIKIAESSLDERYLQRPEWKLHTKNYKDLVDSFGDLDEMFEKMLSEPDYFDDRMRAKYDGCLEDIIDWMARLSLSYSALERSHGNDRRLFRGSARLARAYPLSANWETIKVWSAEFPQVMIIDDMEWLKIGELDIANPQSEKQFKFRVQDAVDAWRSRQKLYFPDGTLIEDTGVAHEGGYSEFTLNGVIPDKHVAVIRMMDYARGDFKVRINVNGVDAGISHCEGNDRKARWRNWPFVIPEYFVNGTSLNVKQYAMTADRDVNMYRIWFYQPINF